MSLGGLVHKSWSSTDWNFHILQYYMKRYVKMIVKMMKEEKLFASQGGPIILSQVWFHLKILFQPNLTFKPI